MIAVYMPAWLRIVINFLLAVLLFWIFKSVGWFSVTDTMSIWFVVAIVGLINIFVSFLMGILVIVLSPVLAVVIACTLGLGALLLGPVVSYFTLYLTSTITHLFTMTTVWWQALIIGCAFSWLAVRTPNSE